MQKKRVELYMARKTRLEDVRGMSSESDMDGDYDWKINASDDEPIGAELPVIVPDVVVPNLPDLGMDDLEAKLIAKLYNKDGSKAKNIESIITTTKTDAIRHNAACGAANQPNTAVSNSIEKNKSISVPVPELLKGLYNRSITSILDLSNQEIMAIVTQAIKFKNLVQKGVNLKELLHGKLVALDFKEPSTRTKCSFQAACMRLGADTIILDAATSSAEKGETEEDCSQMLSSYADLIVMRTPKTGLISSLASNIRKPLINAGDGSGEHPTQALLDWTTIMIERPDLFKADQFKGHIVICGDIKMGRTCNSLINLVGRFNGKLTLVAPRLLLPESEMLDVLRLKYPNSQIETKTSLDSECGRADIWYITRLQKERWGRDVIDQYINVNMSILKEVGVSASLKIMHPLPRNEEISTDVDSSTHQIYFRQAEYGMYTRMALLYFITAIRTSYLTTL